MLCSFTGAWWFAQQEPLDLDPIPATVAETGASKPPKHESDVLTYDEDDDEDGEPLPPPTGEGKPACVSCGDPNFSTESELCIGCRAIGSPATAKRSKADETA